MQLWCFLLMLLINIRCSTNCDELELITYLSFGEAYQHSLIAQLYQAINDEPLLTMFADLQYRDFFIESDDQRNVLRDVSGLLSYYPWRNQDRSLSVTATSYHNGIGPNVFTLSGYEHTPKLNGLERRHSEVRLGLRYQHFWPQHYVGSELEHDIASHYGHQLRVNYGDRQMLYGCDFYYAIGIAFSTLKLVNYYYVITLPESLRRHSVYCAGACQQLQLGVTAVYPLSLGWLFELGLFVDCFGGAYTINPLSGQDRVFISFMTFRYVF